MDFLNLFKFLAPDSHQRLISQTWNQNRFTVTKFLYLLESKFYNNYRQKLCNTRSLITKLTHSRLFFLFRVLTASDVGIFRLSSDGPESDLRLLKSAYVCILYASPRPIFFITAGSKTFAKDQFMSIPHSKHYINTSFYAFSSIKYSFSTTNLFLN